MPHQSLCYSIADQDFDKTKSIGIFNLSLGLLKALHGVSEVDSIDLLTNNTHRGLFPSRRDGKLSRREFSLPCKGKLGRIAWDQWKVYSAAKKSGCDWLFLPKGFMSFLRRPAMRVAAYVHDAMHDHYAVRYPTAVSKNEANYFSRSFNATLKHADVIFTNSEFTASEVLRMASTLGIDDPRVIPAGIGFDPVESHVIRKQDRIVVLSGRFPHKLTGMAVDLLKKWQSDTGNNWGVDWIGSMPEGISVEGIPNWIHHSRLPDNDFQDKISSARLLLFTSDYEGFGMPPVEAVLLGTMPVYSSIPATLEVMDNLGFPFINHDYESFASVMDQAIHASPSIIDEWAQELLKRHAWDKVARRVVSTLFHHS